MGLAHRFSCFTSLSVLASTLLWSRHVAADCGAYSRATTVSEVHRLYASKRARRIFPTLRGEFYLHSTEHCCMAGIPVVGASVYRINGNKLQTFDICEASGVGGKTIKARSNRLVITSVATCRSGDGPSCDLELKTRQIRLNRHPTVLQWTGTGFVNRTALAHTRRLGTRLRAAIRSDNRRVVLQVGKRLKAELEGVQRREAIDMRILRYQVARSLRAIRRGEVDRAVAELDEARQHFMPRLSPRCEAETPLKVALENDIGFLFEQAGQLDRARGILECVCRRDSTRAAAHLNLFDLLTKLYLRDATYPLAGRSHLRKARVIGRRYIELMKERKKERRVPQRVKRLVSSDATPFVSPEKRNHRLLPPVH